jgi:hypothetical protein
VNNATTWKVQLGIVLAAVLVAFAPLYHAVCVAVASGASASETATTMLMPDGTVMTHRSNSAGDAGMPIAANALAQITSGSVMTTDLATGLETNTLVGSILLIAGIVVLTFFLVKLWAQSVRRIALRGPPRPAGRMPSSVPGVVGHGPPPDLAVLCISRT